MRSHDVQDELQEGFEVGPLPPMGPDGAPLLAPLERTRPPRPRLCEAGPCLHYHRFEIQTEAQDPRAVTVPVALPPGTRGAQEVPGGTVYQAPRTFHVERHHYCYPTSGVEMRLGSLPVITCNRWHPISNPTSAHSLGSRASDREDFWNSVEGVKFAADVADWELEHEKELREAQEVERLIEQSMSQPQPQEPSE